MSKVQKPKYRHFSNKSSNKRFTLDINLKGFLCSCNNREKDCIREAYNILNKYADVIWPNSQLPPSTNTETSSTEIEDELQKELGELKSRKEPKRFQVVESGARNFLFIQTTVEDPVKLAQTILCEIFEKKTQETRFLLRLIPVEVTCKAYLKDIENSFELLCDKYFSTSSKTFSIVFNHRNNSSVPRDEVIKNIAELVSKKGQEKGLEHKVDLKNAEVSIVIEIIRSFAFLAVVPDFMKYKKYNLLTFGVPEKDDDSEEVKEEKAAGSSANKSNNVVD